MLSTDLRPRTASEIVDAAFRLLRRHYGAFVAIAAVAAIPGILFQLVQLAVAGEVAVAVPPSAIVWLIVLFIPAYGFTESWFARAASDAYRTGEVRLGDAARGAVRRMLPVAATVFLVWIPVMLGLVLLVAPGIWLLSRLYTTTSTAALEDAGPLTAMRRTWGRTRGRALHTLGTAALSFLLYLVLYVGAVVVAGIVGSITSPLFALGLTAIVAVFVYPMLPVVATVLYYDLRIRAEGYDVEVLAAQLGDPLAGAAPRAGLVGS